MKRGSSEAPLHLIPLYLVPHKLQVMAWYLWNPPLLSQIGTENAGRQINIPCEDGASKIKEREKKHKIYLNVGPRSAHSHLG